MQGDLFVRILNTSMISCYIIIVVMVFRALLLRAERKYVYWLWFVVFVNLCIPFRISGPFSLIPRWIANFDIAAWLEQEPADEKNVVYLPKESIVEQASISTHSYTPIEDAGGVPGTDSNSETLYLPEESEHSLEYLPNEQISEKQSGSRHEYISAHAEGGVPGIDTNTTYHEYHTDNVFGVRLQIILAAVWGIGVCILAVGAVRSARKLQRRLKDAAPFDGGRELAGIRTEIRTADGIGTPFLWGILSPVIYLPRGIDEHECKYIIAHENFHRKRRDHIVKPVFFIIAVIHWFNPLVWAAYFLFVRDMEISCDEAVIAAADEDIRKAYAESILKYAARQNGYTLTPITFGEPSLKCRIQNVLHFRETNTVLSVMMLCSVAVLMMGLMAKPPLEKQKGLNWSEIVPLELLQKDSEDEHNWGLTDQENSGHIRQELVPAEAMLDLGNAARLSGGQIKTFKAIGQ